MNLTMLLIYLFAAVILFLGLQVLCASNKPVHAIFYLVGCFVTFSILLFYLNHEFFALIYMMVYVGAIAVLFLFVIMMLDIKQTTGQEFSARFSSSWGFWGILNFFVILFLLIDFWTITSIGHGWFSTQELFIMKTFAEKDFMRDIFLIGIWLFNGFPELLILIGLILLVAMIGSIIIISDEKQERVGIKKYQNENLQLNRRLFEAIELRRFIKK